MKNTILSMAAMAAVLGAAQFSAHAANPGTYSGSLNWNNAEVKVDKYSGPCDLNELVVRYRIVQSINMSFQSESLDAAASTATANLAASGTYTGPGSIGGATLPLAANNSYPLSSFDGGIDFAGTSGVSDNLNAASDSGWITVGAADEALFVGAGTVSFLFTEGASSSVTGPGNIINIIKTTGDVTVEVDYVCRAVPETGTMAAAAGMVSMIAGAAYRRFRAIKA